MQMLDPEDIQRQVAAIKARSKDGMTKPGADGVTARLEHDIGSALFAWRASESNRQSDPQHVTEGLVSLATSNLAAHMFEWVEPEHYRAFAIGVAQDLLRNLLVIGASSPDQRTEFTEVIESKEMGLA
jgi:hypothetical protein